MRNILLLVLFFQANISYSQFLIGESKEFSKSALKKNNFNFSEETVTDSTSRLSWIVENDYQMILVLDNNNIVIRQTLIPEKKNGVNEFVKWFNKDFVIISETEWRNYKNGRIYKIQLEYILREPLFSITLAPDSN